MAKLKIKAFQKKTKQNKNPNKFTRTGHIKKKILHGWYDRISSQPTDSSDTFDERKVPLTNSRCQQSGPLSQKDSQPHIQITLG